MSFDKTKKERIVSFMDELAQLMVKHKTGLTMDGGLSMDNHLIGYLEQNYDSLDLLDQEDIPIYSAPLNKD